jgi:hypothetical protein
MNAQFLRGAAPALAQMRQDKLLKLRGTQSSAVQACALAKNSINCFRVIFLRRVCLPLLLFLHDGRFGRKTL